jgi:hypothetical protein
VVAGKHLLALIRMAAEAFSGHLHGLGFFREFDQLGVVRDILDVAVGTADRSPVPFLVTAHALPVESTLKPDSFGNLRVERGLVTGGTPEGFLGLGIRRSMMMTLGAISDHPGVFTVHEPDRTVEVFFLIYERAFQKEIFRCHVFEFQDVAEASPPLFWAFYEHILDEGNHFGGATLGLLLNGRRYPDGFYSCGLDSIFAQG